MTMLPVNETENNWTEQPLSESLNKAWTDLVKPGQKSGIAACLSAASTRTSSQISSIKSLVSISSRGSFNDKFSSRDSLPAISAQSTPKTPKTPKSHWSPRPGASPCSSGSDFGSDTEDESQQQANTMTMLPVNETEDNWTEQRLSESLNKAWTDLVKPGQKSGIAACLSAASTRTSSQISSIKSLVSISSCGSFNDKFSSRDSLPAISAQSTPKTPKTPKSHWSPRPGASPCPSGSGFGSDTEDESQQQTNTGYRGPRSMSKDLAGPLAGDPGSPGSGESPVKLNGDKPPVFDSLTIRTWFMMADNDNNGLVTKKEFIHFLISHTDLATLLMKALGEKSGEHTFEWHVKRFGETEHQRVARVYRRLLGFYKTIDVGKNNCLDFDEFLHLFQRAGCVLEYQTLDNPRDRAADLLESLEKTGPVANVRVASHLARRGSEQLWALDQQRDFKCSKLPARRHSTQGLTQPDKEPMSPSDFRGDTLVLGSSALKRRSSTEARKLFDGGMTSEKADFRRRSWA